ncbi:HAD-IA family hydrolase [Halapricum sp. CBA1109]|uniref:HAD family hydrolase n=1 Tax=Halapricum sp. CBA1109 TaxID=2668068 RepID=UPI0012F741C8|nr:HAD family hydrolase [Halapricum sp. CBA1109]MUV89698.1 HAD-IA family hydrolase [Halapricum sp. CBA1109]
MSDYDAVLLDLDGTLCEYVRGKRELLAAAFESEGVDPLFTAADYAERVDSYADRADSMGERRRLCFADLAAENGHDPAVGRAVADAYAAARDHGNVRFLDGAETALSHLADRYPLGLVTNGGPGMQDPKIDGIGVRERFETVVYAGHDVPAKPAPDPFVVALEDLGVRPERTVYVGNNYETDILGAAEADVPAILLGDAPADAPVDPVATIERPGELTDLL